VREQDDPPHQHDAADGEQSVDDDRGERGSGRGSRGDQAECQSSLGHAEPGRERGQAGGGHTHRIGQQESGGCQVDTEGSAACGQASQVKHPIEQGQGARADPVPPCRPHRSEVGDKCHHRRVPGLRGSLPKAIRELQSHSGDGQQGLRSADDVGQETRHTHYCGYLQDGRGSGTRRSAGEDQSSETDGRQSGGGQ
jgi:hypothetical protein